MILRSFHLPAGMDEELRMLSFITKEDKASLIRKMIATGWSSHGRAGRRS